MHAVEDLPAVAGDVVEDLRAWLEEHRDPVTTPALYAPAPPMFGGTDQIQRNVIGERVLGRPNEPNDDKVVPFSSLPKKA